MRMLKKNLGFVAVSGVLFVLGAGCGGADEADGQAAAGDTQAQTDSWYRRYRQPTSSGGTSAGTGGTSAGTGGSAGTGFPVVSPIDCNICTITQACCEAVNAATNNGRTCMFDTDACFSLDPARQKTYATAACLVTLRTTISAWQLAGRTPPAPCRLP
jgi:hypothetical protein